MSRSVIKGLRLRSQEGKLNATEIADAIEQSLLAQRRPDSDWTQKKTFSPSKIGYGHGNCARFWNIAFNGTDSWQDDIDAMGVANMGVGSMVHDYLQKALKSSGFLIEEELEIKLEDPPIRGYLDAIVNWNGERLVCEIKTTRQESFVFKQTSGKPSANHLLQLLIYLKATGIQRGFLLYMNKNDQTMLVIPVELNEENNRILENTLEWLRQVYAVYKDGLTPKIPFVQARNAGKPTNNICRNCPVQKACFAEPESGTVLIPLMEVPTL